jgi:hypothetical protein
MPFLFAQIHFSWNEWFSLSMDFYRSLFLCLKNSTHIWMTVRLEGPVKIGECKEKCDKDHKCAGFIYKLKPKKPNKSNTLKVGRDEVGGGGGGGGGGGRLESTMPLKRTSIS